MAHNPTMVVGIGEAGTKIASTLYDDLEEIYEGKEESFTDEFAFIGIDSREEDVKDFSRPGFQTIVLDPVVEIFGTLKSRHSYLTENHELTDAGGATRQRAVSRYFIDNPRNFDDFYTELAGRFETFDENTSLDGQMNVWVVNSLGGGTGSGAFPFVVSMISAPIATDLDRSLWVGGIGSLPRLEKLKKSQTAPPGNDNLYANAYAALRELSVLLDYDFDDDYSDAAGKEFPLIIPVYSDADQLTTDEGIKLESPPFDFYTLMGIEEDTSDDSFANLNRIASDTMLYFSEKRGMENFGTDVFDTVPEALFCSVTGAHAKVPVDEIRPYLSLKSDLEEVATELKDIRKKINLHRVNRDFLRELSLYEPGEEPTVEPPVATTVIDPDTGDQQGLELGGIEEEQDSPDDGSEEDNRSQQIRETVGMNVVEAWTQIYDAYESASQTARSFPNYTPEILDEQVQDKLLENSAPFMTSLKMDSDTVYKYFYYQELLAEYRENRVENNFRDEIADEWESHKDDIETDDIDDLDDVDIGDINRLSDAGDLSEHELAIRRWEDVLKQYHELRIDRTEAAINDTSWYQISKKKKLKKLLQKYEKRQQELQNLYGTFSKLQEAVNDLEARREEVVRSLDEQQQHLDTKLKNELSEERRKLKEERNKTESSKNKKEKELKEPDNSRFSSFKMEEFSKFTPDLLDTQESIADLENAGVVSAREIIKTIEHIGDEELVEPIEDREDVQSIASRKKYVGGLVAEDDKGILEGELVAQKESVNLDGKVKDFQVIPTQFRIRLIRLFFNVYLENSSEFGTMHDLYRSSEPATSEFEASMTDHEFISEAFAYPELFPDDDQITSYFDITDDDKSLTTK